MRVSIAFFLSLPLCGCASFITPEPVPADRSPIHARDSNSWAMTVQSFDHVEDAALPAGWRVGATHPEGALATWAIVADPSAPTQPDALVLTSSTHGSSGTFNLCWTDKVRFRNGTLELAVRANEGEADQGGGPIWRVRDENNYYVCRLNPLESNFRLYCVKDGVRTELASAEVAAACGTWHRIRVRQIGAHIECTLDLETTIEATDERLQESGGVGVWTKADAETSFDDLAVNAQP